MGVLFCCWTLAAAVAASRMADMNNMTLMTQVSISLVFVKSLESYKIWQLYGAGNEQFTIQYMFRLLLEAYNG